MNNHPRNSTFHLPGIIPHWTLLACLGGLLLPMASLADEDAGSRWQRFKQIRETQRENKETVVTPESLGALTANTHEDAFEGRDMLVYIPLSLPPAGKRSLLVALHGGGGNAHFMQEHLKIDGVAEKNGFIVAYLNGSAAARIGGRMAKAWNAGGGCCGKPYRDKVDDVGHITRAVRYLQQKYGVAAGRTFGVGHSNGAIMMQSMTCLTDVFSKVASLAGTLMAEVPACPAAQNHTIYNYHGALDENLPIAGGSGTKGVTDIDFASQTEAKALFENSGGRYVLNIFTDSDHSIEHLSVSSQKQDGLSIGERLAHDLGLAAAD